MTTVIRGEDLLVGWDTTDTSEEQENQLPTDATRLVIANKNRNSNSNSNSNSSNRNVDNNNNNNNNDDDNMKQAMTKSPISGVGTTSTDKSALPSVMGENDDKNDSSDDSNDINSENKDDGKDDDDDLSFNSDHYDGIKNFDKSNKNNNDCDNFDDDEMNAIVSDNKQSNNSNNVSNNGIQQQPTGLWSRFSRNVLKTSNGTDGTDGAASGLLNRDQMNNDSTHFLNDKDEEGLSSSSSGSSSSVSNSNTSSKSRNDNIDNSGNFTSKFQNQQKPQKQDANKSLIDNEVGNETEMETVQMKNTIEGFGSNAVPQSNEINQTSAKYTGISGFFHNIQLKRIRARHEFDPFSLTEQELEILKEDIRKKFDDLQTMDTAKASETNNNSKIKGWKESIQAAVLAPEAFAAYTDRLVEEDDGPDEMGYYRNVPLGGEDDVVDDYELRQKKMKPMKMEGDNNMTWGEVADAIMDPEAYVIDEDMLEDVDPHGVYRGVSLTGDDPDEVITEKDVETKATKTEVQELCMKVMSLTDKVQNLETELKAKDEETQIWKKKASELEMKLIELQMKIETDEEVDLLGLNQK